MKYVLACLKIMCNVSPIDYPLHGGVFSFMDYLFIHSALHCIHVNMALLIFYSIDSRDYDRRDRWDRNDRNRDWRRDDDRYNRDRGDRDRDRDRDRRAELRSDRQEGGGENDPKKEMKDKEKEAAAIRVRLRRRL